MTSAAEPRTAEWDCDGQACRCHDPFLCSDCGCLHNEAEASRIDVERLARAIAECHRLGKMGPSLGYEPVETRGGREAAAIAKAYEAES
jgi:hypothetical protein